jgi:hypothetical protein
LLATGAAALLLAAGAALVAGGGVGGLALLLGIEAGELLLGAGDGVGAELALALATGGFGSSSEQYSLARSPPATHGLNRPSRGT